MMNNMTNKYDEMSLLRSQLDDCGHDHEARPQELLNPILRLGAVWFSHRINPKPKVRFESEPYKEIFHRDESELIRFVFRCWKSTCICIRNMRKRYSVRSFFGTVRIIIGSVPFFMHLDYNPKQTGSDFFLFGF